MASHRGERDRFREVLDRFDRDGCNLLVVGESHPAVRRAAGHRLFGDADRDRVLVTPTDVDVDAWLPGEGTVVRVDADVRGAPAADAVSPTALPDAVGFEGDDPGQWRLGVTAVEPLLNTSALDALRTVVADANAIGHYHLHAPADAVRRRPIADEFDAIVELQGPPDAIRERWHVDDANLTTGWVRID